MRFCARYGTYLCTEEGVFGAPCQEKGRKSGGCPEQPKQTAVPSNFVVVPNRKSQLYRLLTDVDIDALAVQETKVDGDEETGRMVQRFTTRYFACVSHAVGTSAGCILF